MHINAAGTIENLSLRLRYFYFIRRIEAHQWVAA